MAVAVGHAVTFGVALLTITVTELVTLVKSVVSEGVKVTLCEAVPAPGEVEGVVKVKVPAGLAAPPFKVELARVWP